MDTISQAACDTATLIRQTVPDINDPTRVVHMFNLCLVTAHRSPVVAGADADGNVLLSYPAHYGEMTGSDEQIIEAAIGYVRSKGAA